MEVTHIPLKFLFDANCYLIQTETGYILIDTGIKNRRKQLEDAITDAGCKPGDLKLIIITHGHVDHVAANAEIQRATGGKLLIHEADRELIERPHAFWSAMVGGVEPSRPDGTLAEGDELHVGDLTVRVLHTPGHTPGGVCLAVENLLLTGDTLFAGSIGRTDLPGGDMARLMQSIRAQLWNLPAATVVAPGHGPLSTIGAEKRQNPFLRELS